MKEATTTLTRAEGQNLKNLIKKILQKFNIGITEYGNLIALKEYEKNIQQILSLPPDKLLRLSEIREKTKSQIMQDLFVLLETNFKKNGFFVEFGATNGLDLSNTHLLEKEFQWNGILAEPARVWHNDLRKNRSCNIEENCVWTDTNLILEFNEVKESGLSTITQYNSNDWASANRKSGKIYKVNTFSLEDLLIKYNAPNVIDYLSIDTEGSEFEILNSFDFEKYQFRVITCEHNFTHMREKIYNLLANKGYQRKYVGLSKWDDWYVKCS
jgi:FkbM family methyltransferase